MKIIQNIKIMHQIFEEKLPNYKFDKVDMIFFSRPTNRKIFYIGNRSQDESDKTLFKHNDSDEWYYDILHKNQIYYDNLEKLYQMDSENYCSHLENLDDLVSEYIKRKEVI